MIMEKVESIYVGNIYYIREELNGITVYNRLTHNFDFYENLFLKDVNNISSEKEL